MREKVAKQLYGRDFDIVKEGLDESQVESFIAELINERDMLLQRQQHTLSLTKLAERTVAEADRLAEEIKRETEEAAQAKATAIMAKAEQEAKEVMEQKRAEILAAANKEAEGIKDSARQEVELLMAQHKQNIQVELKEMAQGLHNQLISDLKGLTEKAVSLQAEWESKLSETATGNPPSGDGGLSSAPAPVTPEQTGEVPSSASPAALEQTEETPQTALKADLKHDFDVLEQLQRAWADSDAIAVSEEPPPVTPPELAGSPETGVQEEVTASLEEAEASSTYQGTVVLDILPPLAPVQLVEIQKYLRDWPGIGITELGPKNNGYSITVVLYKPMQLIDILKELPEVADAREYTPEEAEMLGDAATGEDEQKRIAVTVCPHT